MGQTTEPADVKLTRPQKRYLAEIREMPGRRYNGRARRPLEALRAAGLIEYDFELVELVPHADLRYTEVFTCVPTGTALTVECPMCGSAVGEACINLARTQVSTRGLVYRKKTPHAARVRRAGA